MLPERCEGFEMSNCCDRVCVRRIGCVLYAYMYVYMYVYVYVYVNAYVSAYVDAYMYVYMNAYIYVYTYLYTYGPQTRHSSCNRACHTSL